MRPRIGFNLPQRVQVARDHDVFIELRDDLVPASLPHDQALCRREADHLDHPGGQVARILYMAQQAVGLMLDDILAAGHIGGDDRARHGRRLEQRVRHALAVRRQHDAIGLRQVGPDIVGLFQVLDQPAARPARDPFERDRVRIVCVHRPQQLELHRRQLLTHDARRGGVFLDTFIAQHPGHQQEPKRGRCGLPRRIGLEVLQVDPGTRQHFHHVRPCQARIDKQLAIVGILEEHPMRSPERTAVQPFDEARQQGVVDEGRAQAGNIVDDRDTEPVRRNRSIDVRLDRVTQVGQRAHRLQHAPILDQQRQVAAGTGAIVVHRHRLETTAERGQPGRIRVGWRHHHDVVALRDQGLDQAGAKIMDIPGGIHRNNDFLVHGVHPQKVGAVHEVSSPA